MTLKQLAGSLAVIASLGLAACSSGKRSQPAAPAPTAKQLEQQRKDAKAARQQKLAELEIAEPHCFREVSIISAGTDLENSQKERERILTEIAVVEELLKDRTAHPQIRAAHQEVLKEKKAELDRNTAKIDQIYKDHPSLLIKNPDSSDLYDVCAEQTEQTWDALTDKATDWYDSTEAGKLTAEVTQRVQKWDQETDKQAQQKLADGCTVARSFWWRQNRIATIRRNLAENQFQVSLAEANMKASTDPRALGTAHNQRYFAFNAAYFNQKWIDETLALYPDIEEPSKKLSLSAVVRICNKTSAEPVVDFFRYLDSYVDAADAGLNRAGATVSRTAQAAPAYVKNGVSNVWASGVEQAADAWQSLVTAYNKHQVSTARTRIAANRAKMERYGAALNVNSNDLHAEEKYREALEDISSDLARYPELAEEVLADPSLGVVSGSSSSEEIEEAALTVEAEDVHTKN